MLILIITIIAISQFISAADTKMASKEKLKAYAESIIKDQINYNTFEVKDYKESKDKANLMEIDIEINGKKFTWYTTKDNFDKITK